MYEIECALERFQSCKYTFSVPSRKQINALLVDDLVKLMFRDEDGSTERMWVRITKKDDGNKNFEGTLDNQPFGLTSIKLGDHVKFVDTQIIQIYDVGNEIPDFITPITTSFCKITKIAYENKSVGYIFREEPTNSKKKPHLDDSGWRFYQGDESEEYTDNPSNYERIIIGAVLNFDDSFLHLLNEPVDSAFEKDEETKKWNALEDDE